MTKESGANIIKTYDFILKMEWAKYYSQLILSSQTNKLTENLQQGITFPYTNAYLFNRRINFISYSIIEVKSHLGLKVRPIFTLTRNQIKNKILIRFKILRQ